MKKRISGENILSLIDRADISLLEDIMDAISAKFRRDFPEWDVIYLAIPKGDEKKRAETFRWLEEHAIWE